VMPTSAPRQFRNCNCGQSATRRTVAPRNPADVEKLARVQVTPVTARPRRPNVARALGFLAGPDRR
jgi:hypothetical protein